MEPEWVKYNDEVKLQIRPMPNNVNPYKLNADTTIGQYAWEVFDYCVVGWEGFEDEKGNELKFTKKNKELVFNTLDNISNFVMEQQSMLKERFQEEVKN